MDSGSRYRIWLCHEVNNPGWYVCMYVGMVMYDDVGENLNGEGRSWGVDSKNLRDGEE